MNVAVDFFTRPTRFQLLIAAVVCLYAWNPCPVEAQQKTLEFRALATTDKDQKAIDAEKVLFAKAKDDPELKKKLEAAREAGNPPNLQGEATPVKKAVPPGAIAAMLAIPGSLVDAFASAHLAEKLMKDASAVAPPPAPKTDVYTWIKTNPDRLAGLKIMVNEKALKEKIDEARTKGELLVLPPRNLLLYTREGKTTGTIDYFLLARPITDELKISGDQIQKVEVRVNNETFERGVLIKLNPEGKAKLQKFSKENLQGSIVILVDGQPIHSFKLVQELNDGVLLLRGALNAQKANTIKLALESSMKK